MEIIWKESRSWHDWVLRKTEPWEDVPWTLAQEPKARLLALGLKVMWPMTHQ